MTPQTLLGQITRRALISAADRLVAPTKYPLVATTEVAAVATDTCDGTCPWLGGGCASPPNSLPDPTSEPTRPNITPGPSTANSLLLKNRNTSS